MNDKLIAIKITIETAEKVLQYLSNQPYNQVSMLIESIQKSEPVYAEVEKLESKEEIKK